MRCQTPSCALQQNNSLCLSVCLSLSLAIKKVKLNVDSMNLFSENLSPYSVFKECACVRACVYVCSVIVSCQYRAPYKDAIPDV